MRFVVDECAGPSVAAWLTSLGHEVYSVFDEKPGMDDENVLAKAASEEQILITIDKDFGEMIFRERREHKGVILLRLSDERSFNKIAVLQEVLENYSERIPGQFVTATENKIRFS